MNKTLITSIACGISLQLSGQNFTTQSVSIFKNGTGFFHKSGTVEVKNGSALLSSLNIANPSDTPLDFPLGIEDPEQNEVLFGSLWFHGAGNIATGISRYDQSTETPTPLQDLPSLIRANAGKPATFILESGSEPIQATSFTAEGSLLTLEAKGKWITVPIGDVKSVEFGQKPQLSRNTPTLSRFIKLDFEKDKATQPLDMMYMQRGIVWMPNYLVEIDGNGKANVTLRASVLNDIEDLKDVEMNFVVGVPTFKHSNTPSPFTSNQRVAQFMNSLAGAARADATAYMGNTLAVQSMSNFYNEARYDRDMVVDFVPEGSTQEDLYFYRREKVTLPKGGRAFFQLLQTETEYSQLYTCTLPTEGGYGEPQNHPAWSTLRIKNNSGKPFTTGSVFVQKTVDGKTTPISEGELSFTPSGIYTQIKTTQAPDISVQWNEEEVSRTRSTHEYHNLLEMKGTVEIANLKDKEVEMVIDKTIIGFLDKSDANWETTSRYPNAGAKNKENDVQWKVKLGAGEKKTISYGYKVHVRQ